MWDNFISFIGLVGTIGTIFAVLSAIVVTYWTIRGFLPVLLRLGYGLWRRKIAIIAVGDAYENLEQLIKETRLFNSKNIVAVRGHGELEQAASVDVLLVHWPDCNDFIDDILDLKTAGKSLVVYAPPTGGRLPEDVMAKLELRRNVVLNNFRGRLLNDIVSCLITTAYEKK